MLRQLPLWVAALWWGSLSTLGFFVVPMLFFHLPTPALAGDMAAALFTVQTALSASCGLLLLLIFRSDYFQSLVDIGPSATLFIVFGMLLALLVEFGVAPHIRARDNLALWHSLGTAMYALQWISAAVVLQKLFRSGCASSR